jgi:hypothetical protein
MGCVTVACPSRACQAAAAAHTDVLTCMGFAQLDVLLLSTMTQAQQ